MRRVALMSGMVVGVVAACGGSASSPLLIGSSPDSGTTDSSTHSIDAGADRALPADTGLAEGPSRDSNVDSEAVDAKSHHDAGCPSFCAKHTPTPGSCNDFDESSSIPSDLTVVANDGGSVTISETEAVSCTNSLSAELPMIGSPSTSAAVAFAEGPFTASSSTITLDLDVYLPDDTMSYVTFFALKLGDGLPLGLQHHGDAFWFLGNSSQAPETSINVGLTTPPLVGAWNHMTLEVVYSTTAGSATLTYEGDDHTTHSVMFSGATTASSSSDGMALLGMIAPETTETAFATYYDNVVLRVGP
jgi:hypothetical protein